MCILRLPHLFPDMSNLNQLPESAPHSLWLEEASMLSWFNAALISLFLCLIFLAILKDVGWCCCWCAWPMHDFHLQLSSGRYDGLLRRAFVFLLCCMRAVFLLRWYFPFSIRIEVRLVVLMEATSVNNARYFSLSPRWYSRHDEFRYQNGH